MKKYIILLSIYSIISLQANDRISQLKAAIVRSDDLAVTKLLTQGALSPKEVYELCGWADDSIEERRLRALTTGEELSLIGGGAGIGMVIIASLGYSVHDTVIMKLLKKCHITTGTRAALSAAGSLLLCLYSMQRGDRGAQKRLNKAYAVKDILEQQLMLQRKEES